MIYELKKIAFFEASKAVFPVNVSLSLAIRQSPHIDLSNVPNLTIKHLLATV